MTNRSRATVRMAVGLVVGAMVATTAGYASRQAVKASAGSVSTPACCGMAAGKTVSAPACRPTKTAKATKSPKAAKAATKAAKAATKAAVRPAAKPAAKPAVPAKIMQTPAGPASVAPASVSLAPGQTAPLQPTAYANVQVRFQPGPSPTGMGAASIGLMPGVDPSTIVLPSRPRAAADVSRPVVEHLPNGATRVLVGTDHMAYTYARRLPSGKLEATCETNGSHDHSAAPAQKEARK